MSQQYSESPKIQKISKEHRIKHYCSRNQLTPISQCKTYNYNIRINILYVEKFDDNVITEMINMLCNE